MSLAFKQMPCILVIITSTCMVLKRISRGYFAFTPIFSDAKYTAVKQHVRIYVRLFSYRDTSIIETVHNSLESNFDITECQIQFWHFKVKC